MQKAMQDEVIEDVLRIFILKFIAGQTINYMTSNSEIYVMLISIILNCVQLIPELVELAEFNRLSGVSTGQSTSNSSGAFIHHS